MNPAASEQDQNQRKHANHKPNSKGCHRSRSQEKGGDEEQTSREEKSKREKWICSEVNY